MTNSGSLHGGTFLFSKDSCIANLPVLQAVLLGGPSGERMVLHCLVMLQGKRKGGNVEFLRSQTRFLCFWLTVSSSSSVDVPPPQAEQPLPSPFLFLGKSTSKVSASVESPKPAMMSMKVETRSSTTRTYHIQSRGEFSLSFCWLPNSVAASSGYSCTRGEKAAYKAQGFFGI